MLRTLIRQELLTHLMSARFFTAVVITFLLVIANTVVLIDEHENRVANYSQQEKVHREKAVAAETYSRLEIFVERPPNPLSLFSAGLDKRLGTTVEIYHGEVPMISSVSARNLENPYLNLFSQIDLVSIFQVVLSLLSLLFAYDAIAGDRESGTLRLVISHPVRRGVHSVREIHRCHDMLAAACADESADGANFVLPREFDSTQRVGFPPNWRDSLDDNCLLIRFLPHRTIDLHNNPPHGYFTDALYVLMGRFGPRLSELESVHHQPRERYAC